MSTRSISGVIISILVFISGTTTANAKPETVSAWKPSSMYEMQRQFIELLKPTYDRPMHTWVHVVPDARLKTHARVMYTSETPIPIQYSPYGVFDVDTIASILPPAESGDVLLPLTISPGWNSWSKGYHVSFYGLKDSPPKISDVSLVDKGGFFSHLFAYIKHPFHSQYLGISSSNFLLGYRIGDISMYLIVGIAMIIAIIVFAIWRKKKFVHAFAIVCMSVILIFQARFLIDYAFDVTKGIYEWKVDGTYKQVGDNYAMAEKIIEESPKEVTICGDLTTLVRYFLHPIPTAVSTENWTSATHAFLSPPWDTANGIVYCREQSRPGEILQIFHDGSALARFTPLPKE
jgi:hypothetical protein